MCISSIAMNLTIINVSLVVIIITLLDVPKPKYCGASNLCEDLY